jgi:hypothetical protein
MRVMSISRKAIPTKLSRIIMAPAADLGSTCPQPTICHRRRLAPFPCDGHCYRFPSSLSSFDGAKRLTIRCGALSRPNRPSSEVLWHARCPARQDGARGLHRLEVLDVLAVQ